MGKDEKGKPKKKPIGKRIRNWTLYILAMLLLAELFYRFAWEEPPRSEIVPDNHAVYHHVPKMFIFRGGLGEFDFRGRSYDIAKKPGTVRVVFIGDSFTYGFTPAKQTIPYYFNMLAKTELMDTDIEVLNFGYLSYATMIHHVTYRRLIRELKADYIIHLYDTFDSQEDSLYARLAEFDEDGEPLAVVGEHFRTKGIRASALVRFIQFALEVVSNDGSILPKELLISSRLQYLLDPQRYPEQIGWSFGLVERLAKKIEDDGSKYTLFYYPPVHMFEDTHEFRDYFAMVWGIIGNWTRPETNLFANELFAFCKTKSLDCHDFSADILQMENELGPEGSRLQIFNNVDAHFTGKANRRFARFIMDTMKKQGFPAAVNPSQTH